MKVPLGGGSPTTLASGQYFMDIAVDATSVYWMAGSAVMKVPLGGGSPTTLAFGQRRARRHRRGRDQRLLDDYTDGTVMKVPLGGGSPTTLASGQSWPYRHRRGRDQRLLDRPAAAAR